MARNSDMRVMVRLIFTFLVLLAQPAFAAEDAAKQQAERQVTQPLNNEPFWRDVRRKRREDLAVLAVFAGLLFQHTAGASSPMPQRERAIESLGGFAQVLL